MFKLIRGKFRIGNLRASPKRRKGPRWRRAVRRKGLPPSHVLRKKPSPKDKNGSRTQRNRKKKRRMFLSQKELPLKIRVSQKAKVKQRSKKKWVRRKTKPQRKVKKKLPRTTVRTIQRARRRPTRKRKRMKVLWRETKPMTMIWPITSNLFPRMLKVSKNQQKRTNLNQRPKRIRNDYIFSSVQINI